MTNRDDDDVVLQDDDDIVILQEVKRASTPRRFIQTTLDRTWEWPFDSGDKQEPLLPMRSSTPKKKRSALEKTWEWLSDSDEEQETAAGAPPPPERRLSLSDSIFNESFEQLKRPEKPKGEMVVRKKVERQKLSGQTCKCCEKYFDGLGLNPEERQKRVNQVSRHRSNIVRPKTPEHFWDTDLPSTQEMIARGYWKQTWKTDKKESK